MNFAEVANFILWKAKLILFCEILERAFDILCSVAVKALAHHYDSFFWSWPLFNVEGVWDVLWYAFLTFVYAALEFAFDFYNSFDFAQECDVDEFTRAKFRLVNVTVDLSNHVLEDDAVLLKFSSSFGSKIYFLLIVSPILGVINRLIIVITVFTANAWVLVYCGYQHLQILGFLQDYQRHWRALCARLNPTIGWNLIRLENYILVMWLLNELSIFICFGFNQDFEVVLDKADFQMWLFKLLSQKFIAYGVLQNLVIFLSQRLHCFRGLFVLCSCQRTQTSRAHQLRWK